MPLLDDLQSILRETFEGGQPGQPTLFLDGTKADGSGNHGLFATRPRRPMPRRWA